MMNFSLGRAARASPRWLVSSHLLIKRALRSFGFDRADFADSAPVPGFSSLRPDFSDPSLAQIAFRSFSVLTDAVRDLGGADPFTEKGAMLDAMAAWSVVHGLAHLLLAGQLSIATDGNTDQTYAEIIRRALPAPKGAE